MQIFNKISSNLSLIAGIAFLLLTAVIFIGKDFLKKDSKTNGVALQPDASVTPGKFLFVGMCGSRAGLYVFDKKVGSPQRFFESTSESVIDFQTSRNGKFSFFVTTTGYDSLGVFPNLQNTKLYRIDNDENFEISEITNFGNCLQIYTVWEDEHTYKIILNALDLVYANFVDQNTLYYDSIGQLIKSEQQKFDLQKTGYPQFPKSVLFTTSRSGLFALVVSGEKEIKYSFKDLVKENGRTILTSKKRLKQIDWARNDSLVVFSLLNVNIENNRLDNSTADISALYIYDFATQEIISKWEGGGFKNFRISGNWLIFDNNFDKDSELLIYDIKLRKEVGRIKVPGGCGLRSVPQLPDYKN